MEAFSRDLENLDRATLPLGSIFAIEAAAAYQAMSEALAEIPDWTPSRFERDL